MNGKALIYLLLGTVSLIGASYLFFSWLDLKFLIPLALSLAAVILIWMGFREMRTKKQ